MDFGGVLGSPLQKFRFHTVGIRVDGEAFSAFRLQARVLLWMHERQPVDVEHLLPLRIHRRVGIRAEQPVETGFKNVAPLRQLVASPPAVSFISQTSV